MKLTVSLFEKLLVTTIVFVFCIVVLVQIFVNNDVLGTIKANEDGTPVSFEQSSAYSPKASLEFSLSPMDKAVLLLNGEEVKPLNSEESQSLKVEVYDGDVLEVKNLQDELVTFHIIRISDEISTPSSGDKVECKKGITYLFKVQLEKIS